MKTIVFIGAGISGLSAATYYLKKFPGDKIIILEKNPVAGGSFVSEQQSGFTFEYGPRGVLKTSHAFFHLLNETNGWHLLKPGKKTSSTRFIWYKNQLNQLGGNPFKMLFAPAMKGVICSALKERNLKNSCPDEDESLESFFTRRFGSHITKVLLDAFISGVWAGDISKLSVRSAFPSLWEAEKKYGSVIRGLRAGKEESKRKKELELANFPHPETGKSRFYSTEGGIQNFAKHLAERFGDKLKTGVSVVSLLKNEKWEVELSSGEVLLADEVVFSTPASVTAKLVESFDPALAAELQKIDYAPVVSVNLGFTTTGTHQQGFGFLIPKIENKPILGIIFNSGTFDGVSPSGGANYTVMIGGACNPDAVKKSEAELIRLALESLDSFLGIKEKPVVTGVKLWPAAIPQYNVGHFKRVDAITNLASSHPGLHLLGNWKNGIGVNDCIKSGFNWVKSLN